MTNDSKNSPFLPNDRPSTVGEALTAVCQAAVKMVGVEHSGLVLFDRDGRLGSVKAEYPPLVPSLVGTSIQVLGVSEEEALIRMAKPIVINDVRTASQLGPVQPLLIRFGIQSLVVVPIVIDGVVRGSLSFDSLSSTKAFTADEIDNCRRLAEFASLTVRNVRLIESLEALELATLGIASERDRKQLLETIISQAVQLLQATGGGIYDFNEEQQELTVIASYPNDIIGRILPAGQGLAGRLIVGTSDSMAVPSYQGWDGKAEIYADGGRFGSVLAAVLSAQQRRTGVLWVNATDGRQFDQFETELLRRLAAIASIALAHSALRDRDRYRVERLNFLAEATTDIARRIGTEDRDSRLTMIARYAHRNVDAQGCGILLVEDPEHMTWVANHGDTSVTFEKNRRFPIRSGPGLGLTGHIAAEGTVFRSCGESLLSHAAVAQPDSPSAPACHSLLAVPLKGHDGVLRGLLRISNKLDASGQPNSRTCFTVDDVAIAEIFAQAALVQIETADLLDKIKREQERFRVLLRACNIIGSAKVPDHGLFQLAEMVVNHLNKSFCRILLKVGDQGLLRVVASAQGTSTEPFQWSNRRGESTATQSWTALEETLKSGKPRLLTSGLEPDRETLATLSHWLEIADIQHRPIIVQSLLWIPLKVGTTIVGLMSIGELRSTERSFFSPGQIEDGVAISSTVSVLIERIERDRAFIDDLFRTEREIASSTSLERTLELICKQVFGLASSSGRSVVVVSVALIERSALKVVAAVPGTRRDSLTALSIPTSPINDDTIEKPPRIGIVGRAIRSGTTTIVDDVRTDPDYVNCNSETRSQLSVPIKDSTGASIGALSVESEIDCAFDSQDIAFVEGLASQAASAITRDHQSRENKKVRTVALVGAAASIWKHSLGAAAKQIADELDKSLIDIQGPPAVIAALKRARGRAEDLKSPFRGPLSETEGVMVEALNHVIEERLRSVLNYMRSTGTPISNRVDLSDSDGVEVRINKVWFHFAFGILLDNAFEAARQGARPAVNVRTEMIDRANCRVLIENTGPKIPDDIWQRLGHERISKDDSGGEHGAGLLIADLILAVYGGRLEKVGNTEDKVVMGIAMPVHI